MTSVVVINMIVIINATIHKEVTTVLVIMAINYNKGQLIFALVSMLLTEMKKKSYYYCEGNPQGNSVY